MKKLVCIPVLLILAPQVAWAGFYAVMAAMLHPTGDGADALKGMYAIVAAFGFVITCVMAGVWVHDEIPNYEERQERLRQRREEELRRLDEQIGIPRIPVRK